MMIVTENIIVLTIIVHEFKKLNIAKFLIMIGSGPYGSSIEFWKCIGDLLVGMT